MAEGLFNEEQQSRLQQYRRGKRAADSSVSDLGGPSGGTSAAPTPQVGQPRNVEWAGYFPSSGAQSFPQDEPASRSGAPFFTSPVDGGAGRNPVTANILSKPTQMKSSVSPAGLNSSGAVGSAAYAMQQKGVPADFVHYILDLEQQNQELRQHIQFLQESLLHQPTQEALRELNGEVGIGSSSVGLHGASEEQKKAFLNEVLSQIEIVIQAHRNKMAVEIQRYKVEAEEARAAVRNLRDAIQQEGMDLSLAPALVMMEKRYHTAVARVAHHSDVSSADATKGSAPQGVALPPDAQHLLDVIATDILNRLSSVEDGDDVNALVRDAVKISFEALVSHFTSQVIETAKENNALVESLRQDLNAQRDDFRMQLTMSENQRVALVQQSEQEIQALRDQLHAYHVASTQGDVEATVQERALDEYTAMLVEARQESMRLRRELEDERNHSAQVCLKLKSSLQKRNGEFERTVVEKAETVIREKQKELEALEAALRAKGGLNPKLDKSTQAGESMMVNITPQNFVSQIVGNKAVPLTPPPPQQQQRLFETPKSSNVGKGALSSANQYEHEVWRKTQELLEKYSTAASTSFSTPR